MKHLIHAGVAMVCLVVSQPTSAWNAQGHQTVGAIADSLLAGTNAGKAVKKCAGRGRALKPAEVGACCHEGVMHPEQGGVLYVLARERRAVCPAVKLTGEKEDMVDYEKANENQCPSEADEEVCHNQNH